MKHMQPKTNRQTHSGGMRTVHLNTHRPEDATQCFKSTRRTQHVKNH